VQALGAPGKPVDRRALLHWPHRWRAPPARPRCRISPGLTIIPTLIGASCSAQSGADRHRPPPPSTSFWKRSRSRASNANGCSGLGHDLGRLLSSRRPRHEGCRRRPSFVHSAKRTSPTRPRANPVGCGLLGARQRVSKGAVRPPELRESTGEVSEDLVGEARADLPHVAKGPTFGDAEEERADPLIPSAPALRVAPDHHLLGHEILDLDPLADRRPGR